MAKKNRDPRAPRGPSGGAVGRPSRSRKSAAPPKALSPSDSRRRGDRTEAAPAAPSLDDLLRQTRRELIEQARGIGLTGLHRLTKAALAARYLEELERLDAGHPPDALSGSSLGSAPVAPGGPQRIPWGHGQDRVTAMVVDPEWLYVYWEVTDEALERARAALGRGGKTAWLNLRVYDVTDRIFDGTNAHDYFDHTVSRTDRQWFFSVGRPSSTSVVEIGLKSEEGYFVRIVRSGRADFPRLEPAPLADVEWLTVHQASGEVGEPNTVSVGPPVVSSVSAAFDGRPEPARVWDIRRTHGGWDGERSVRDEGVRTIWAGENAWTRTTQWEGLIVRTIWEAGPFPYPVEAPRYVEERFEGEVTYRSVDGGSHVVYGSWQVVIRGIGAKAERRVLAVWEIQRSWRTDAGAARRVSAEAVSPRGGSELAPGASELYWRAASEQRLGGASELYLFGASELRYLGASELWYAGASEWRARGASERRYLGASEWRERGASEVRLGGASERLHVGASERMWPGASEHRPRYPSARVGPAAPRR